jgi:hypothetical protein
MEICAWFSVSAARIGFRRESFSCLGPRSFPVICWRRGLLPALAQFAVEKLSCSLFLLFNQERSAFDFLLMSMESRCNLLVCPCSAVETPLRGQALVFAGTESAYLAAVKLSSFCRSYSSFWFLDCDSCCVHLAFRVVGYVIESSD